MSNAPLVSDKTISRVTKSVFDLGIPGFSCYIDGDYRTGAQHTVGGLVAGIALGPVGVWLVAANSIARSSTGRNLWNLGGRDAQAPAPAAAATAAE